MKYPTSGCNCKKTIKNQNCIKKILNFIVKMIYFRNIKTLNCKNFKNL